MKKFVDSCHHLIDSLFLGSYRLMWWGVFGLIWMDGIICGIWLLPLILEAFGVTPDPAYFPLPPL